MTGKLRPKMPNVALELENTPINSEIPYNQTSKRQTTELQAGAPNSKQRYSGKKTHSAVFATIGSNLLNSSKIVDLAPVKKTLRVFLSSQLRLGSLVLGLILSLLYMQNSGNRGTSNYMPNAMSNVGLDFFTIFLQHFPIAN